MKTMNSIMLRRKNRLIIPEGYLLDEPSSDSSLQHMLSIANEMKQLGYVLSPHLAAALLRLNPKYLKDFYDEMIDTLKELVGADVEYKPMYKGFPETVIEKSDEELLMDQLFGYCLDFHSYLHNWFCGEGEEHNFRDHFEFDEKKDVTIPLDDSNIEYTVVRMAEMEDAHKMFEALMAQPEAFSRQDEQDLKWYFQNYAAVVKDYIPAEIPNKENLTLIIVLAHQNSVETVHKFKTATDVLRYAVKLSDGDSSLSSRCWFKHFTRSEARLILDSLEAIYERALEEDIMRRPEEFKRLMKGIHINSERYSKRYPKVYEVMKRVYSNDIHETYNARLERYFNNDEISAAAKHLMRRPGEMARSLDRLLRMARNDEERLDFIELFAAKTEQIPTKLLWELSKYFENRQKGAPRIAMVKSSNAFIPVRLPDFKTSWQFSDVVYDRLQEVLKEGIRAQYATRDKLKYVMCDNQLDSYLMPTANRSTDSASRPLTRGTRMKVSDNANILRLFLYWQGDDVDLSVVLANKDFSKVTNISWENSFRSDYFRPKDVVHSGDITYAKQGAAEFVDLNIQSMKQSMPDIKYAIMFVYSFSKIPFNRIEKCYAGVMERSTMGKRKYYRSRIEESQGNIYEAKTVKVKANLTSSSLSVIPLSYDFETNEVIWLDAASNADDYSISRSSVERARTTLDYFSVQRKPNIHEVIMANVEARDGTLVAKCTIMDEEGNEYDVWCKAKTNELLDINDDEVLKFSLDEGITPCDLEELLTNYL